MEFRFQAAEESVLRPVSPWAPVDGKPVRARQASAEWCKKAVDVCWNSKVRNIREAERPAARAA